MPTGILCCVWKRILPAFLPGESTGPLALAHAGDHHHAAAEADDLSRLPTLSPSDFYNLACIQGLNAASRPLPIREKDGDGYAGKALVLLQLAAKAGFFQNEGKVAKVQMDDDLSVLRERADYRAFIATLPPVKAKP